MKALRQMPPVNDVLTREELAPLGSILEQPFVSRILNEVLEDVRARVRSGQGITSREALTRDAAVDARARIDDLLRPSLRHVINASGVILHTNLGRAPVPGAAIDHLKDVSVGYCNLEFNIEEGGRGRRDDHVVRLINELLGSEGALVVNNNAAAVLLVLNSLAEGGEVLVSRGEEVEIGGSFRIPDVMLKSGARLKEVGTTNRTRIEDYRAASGPETRALLRVHPSNFKVIGFTERPSLEEFVELGRSLGVPTFEDIGSGCLSGLSGTAMPDEPLARESLGVGVDVVSFSGDKLMGGPQVGIVAGRRALVDRIRSNALFRALRVDKLTLAVLESVLLLHLKGQQFEVPVLRMLMTEESELRERATALAAQVGDSVTPAPMKSVIGGGSAPETEIASWGLSLFPSERSPAQLESGFRNANPPVLVRIEGDRVLMDLRTVFREEEETLLRLIGEIVSG